jgi:hypothetical protein
LTPLVVVQNNLVRPLTDPLAERVRGMGIALHDLSSGDMEGRASVPPGEWGPILVVGSILFVHRWAREDPVLSNWMFWNDPSYDAALWAERLGPRYMNHTGRPTTVRGFTASDDGPMHVRPRSGVKMVGEVVRTESRTGYESVSGIVDTPAGVAKRGIDGDTPIWVSAPRTIASEVRVWMIGGAPAAASMYRLDDRHHRTTEHPYVEEAVEEAVRCHGTWRPDRHYVVDMALTDDGWRIVEYNPIHSSGWYAADPGDVVRAFMLVEGVAV